MCLTFADDNYALLLRYAQVTGARSEGIELHRRTAAASRKSWPAPWTMPAPVSSDFILPCINPSFVC